MTVKRSVRVAGRLREELAAKLRDLSDPRLVGVLVTRVELPDDLSLAHVFVRRELGADEAQQRAMVKALGSASSRLRRDLARSLSLRYTPDLRFHYDDAPDDHSRVEEILREIKREASGGGQEGA